MPAYALDPDGVSAYAKFGELKKLGIKWPAGVTLQLLACRPQSRGSIGLNSTDPFERPALDINYLTDDQGADMATLKAGLRIARDMSVSPSLKNVIAEEGFPGEWGAGCKREAGGGGGGRARSAAPSKPQNGGATRASSFINFKRTLAAVKQRLWKEASSTMVRFDKRALSSLSFVQNPHA